MGEIKYVAYGGVGAEFVIIVMPMWPEWSEDWYSIG